jgi:glycosyltransferase involved in cell wall biosynthesis
MRVAIVAPSPVPFLMGGAQRLWDGLYHHINEETPHVAELIKLPTPESNLAEVVRGYQQFAGLDLGSYDCVISTKYPAWMVEHPNHVVYMQHTLRGLYDTYHLTGLPTRARSRSPGLRRLQRLMADATDRSALPAFFERFDAVRSRLGDGHPALAFPGPLAREIVHFLDRIALAPGEIARYTAISRTVARRAGYFPPGVPVTVVHHPSNLQGLHEGPFEHLFTASRLEHPKRIDLLIRAMRDVPGDVELLIAGSGPQEDELRALAGDDRRIRFMGSVPPEQLADLYARAVAVPFVPMDEDLGLITLEAMASGKPVVTCVDSGGPTELVRSGHNGFVATPAPRALAGALTRLTGAPQQARRLGAAARETARGVTWGRVVGTLLGSRPQSRPGPGSRRSGKPKLVVTSTFPVDPPRSGGQLRAAKLYGGLASSYDIEIVSLEEGGDGYRETVLAEGVTERVVPASAAHAAAERRLSASLGWVPVTDIVASQAYDLTPEYLEVLRAALPDAAAVILAHPYLYPAVRELAPDIPVVYDAHNVEAGLKADVLGESETAREVLAWVRHVEGAAMRDSRLVTTCSAEDADTLRELYRADVPMLVVPNGVDVGEVPFTPLPERRRNSAVWRSRYEQRRPGQRPDAICLFVGSWHPPNLEAAEQIFDLASEREHLVFVLVGSHTDAFMDRRVPDNVVLMGVVGNGMKGALMRCADVALNPMTSGSGTNLKMLEYFAAGVPVVSTTFGARGFDAEAGRHYVSADDRAMGPAIELVLRSSETPEIVARARELVVRRFDWQQLAGGMAQRLAEAIGREAAPRG